jgi:spore maturation protein CgeB
VLLARSARDVLEVVQDMPESDRLALAARARERILAEHTAAHRAEELVALVLGTLARSPSA